MPEIITLRKISKEIEDDKISTEDALELALKCDNCEHRDILGKFLVEVKEKRPTLTDDYTKHKPIFPTVNRYWVDQSKKPVSGIVSATSGKSRMGKSAMAMHIANYVNLSGLRRRENLVCPKCGSSLIVLDEKFANSNLMKYVKKDEA